jgi:hypothetical protein
MNHRANADFWNDYHALPADIRARADKQFALQTPNPKSRRQPAAVRATNLIAQAALGCPLSGRIALMPKVLSAEDIFPLVDCLSPHERLRLLRLIAARPSGEDREAYRAIPPRDEEFSTDQDPLAWDAEGWEDIG